MSREITGCGLAVYVFDLGGYLGPLGEHSRDRTIFFFRQTDRVLDGLARNFTADAVHQLDLCVHRGRLGGTLGFGADFEVGKGFALLLQNGDDVIAGAAAEADENQFHWAVTASFVAIDHDRVTATGDTVEL